MIGSQIAEDVEEILFITTFGIIYRKALLLPSSTAAASEELQIFAN